MRSESQLRPFNSCMLLFTTSDNVSQYKFVVFAQVRILTLPVLLPVTPSAPTGRSCSTSSFSLPESRHFFTQPQTDRSGDWTDRMRWSDAPRAGRIWRGGSTTLREIGKTSTSSWSTAQSGSQPHAYTLATMCYRTCWHQKRYYKHASLIGGGLRAVLIFWLSCLI